MFAARRNRVAVADIESPPPPVCMPFAIDPTFLLPAMMRRVSKDSAAAQFKARKGQRQPNGQSSGQPGQGASAASARAEPSVEDSPVYMLAKAFGYYDDDPLVRQALTWDFPLALAAAPPTAPPAAPPPP